jgi:hypothetical protein
MLATTRAKRSADKRMRQDWEKQVSYGQDQLPKSFYYGIAQRRRDPTDGSIDVAVWPFSNK